MLVVGGILNIIVPTGMGAVVCGLATNKRQFVVIGSFQLLTSFLIVGVVWSMLTGIQMIAQGSGLFKVPRHRTTQTKKISSPEDRDLEAGPAEGPSNGSAAQPASTPSTILKDIPLCEPTNTQDFPRVEACAPAKAQASTPSQDTPDRAQTSVFQVHGAGGSSEHATTALEEEPESRPDDQKPSTLGEGSAQPEDKENVLVTSQEKPVDGSYSEEQGAAPGVGADYTNEDSAHKNDAASAPGPLIDLAAPSPPPPPTSEGTEAGVEAPSQPAIASSGGHSSPTKKMENSPRQGEPSTACPELPVELI